jgi:hypothetical protein
MLDMHTRLLARGLFLIMVASVATACGSPSLTSTPASSESASASPGASAAVSPSGSGPIGSPSASLLPTPDASVDQATYARIETQVEQLRQLSPKSTVTPILLDEQGVRDWMTKATQTGVDHQALAAESRLLIHLGMLPAGSSIEQLELDLNAGQAIGFYDPDSKGLYLLSTSGSVGPEEQLTFSHEFTHALQDQNFGLDKLAIDTPDQGDRDLAHTALPEGDATLSMTQWAEANMSILDLLSVSVSAGSGPQADQLAKAPAILREDLDFPYLDGLTFVEGIYAQGGWAAVDKLYANPPNSTSEILHPDLYAKGFEPVNPTLAAVPATLGPGWTAAIQDTLGELQLRVWLEGEHPTAASKQVADAAAAQWAGDRVGLYEGPNGAWAVVLRTQWRSPAGRAAFVAAANGPPLVRAPGPHYLVCEDALQADIYIGSDDATVSSFAPCQPAT